MNEWMDGQNDGTNEYQVDTQNPFEEYMSDSDEEEQVSFDKNHEWMDEWMNEWMAKMMRPMNIKWELKILSRNIWAILLRNR